MDNTFCSRLILILGILAFSAAPTAAAVPAGFVDSVVASTLTLPTAMAFAPDGRLFICEQWGSVRIVKNGVLLPTPFVGMTADYTGERGLLGIALDPDFHSNNFVYVYYTTAGLVNRISRFTANGDEAVAGSEAVLFELDGTAPGNHNGGAIHFGPDRKLYIAVGDYSDGANSQMLTNQSGKMLRLNTDGSIPTDNPFFGTAAGKNRAIWALGLRNPFTFGFNRQTGRMFINDVGAASFEEINDGIAGSNYGWPNTEGETTNPLYRTPLYTYARGGNPFHCAIVGGAFYAPVTAQFPVEFFGDYFFSDLCAGIIKRFKPSTGEIIEFGTGASTIVDLKVGADGALYYLSRGDSAVHRVSYTPATDERFTIGVGPFTGSAGRLNARSGKDTAYAWRAALQVPWSTYTANGGGTHPAMGDVDGDGLEEIVIGLTSGGAGYIAILDDAAHGHALLRWLQVPWSTYNNANGTVFPAVGNLDSDQADEIVVGLGNGSGGYYTIFDDASSNFNLLAWRQVPWASYNAANGTTHPTIGDVDGDRVNDIVLGLGTGSGGFLAIVEGGQQAFAFRRWIRGHWTAYNSTGGGTWPAIGDVDGDGRGEIVVGLGSGGGGYAEIIDDGSTGFANKSWIRVSWDNYNASNGETHPIVANLDNDAAGEIVVGHAAFANEGGWVEIFDDALTMYARQGWRNAEYGPARAAGAASYPTAGRMR